MVTLQTMSQSSERYPVVVVSFLTCFSTHTFWSSAFALFLLFVFIRMHPALSQAFQDRDCWF